MSDNFKNKNVLVIGGGVSGQGAEYALGKSGASVYLLDESKSKDKSLLTQKFAEQFDLVVLSPSVDLKHKIYGLAAKAKIEVISEVELGARLFDGTVIGITGTNGKTTVTQLLGAMLRQSAGAGIDRLQNTSVLKPVSVSVCGNVGYSFARAVAEEQPEIALVELSSFQLEQYNSYLRNQHYLL